MPRDDDDEDLIGGPPLDDDEDLIGGPLPRWQTTRAPVSVDYLANVFRLSRDTVRKKLADCPEVTPNRYDFLEASQRLVVPRFSVEEYLRVLKKGDMPPTLLDATWSAMLKRQRWEENAGDLWRTEKVVEVFGEAFKRMKTSLQLFTDAVEQEHVLSEPQRQTLVRLVDGLQRDLHEQLVGMVKQKRTPSQVVEAPDDV